MTDSPFARLSPPQTVLVWSLLVAELAVILFFLTTLGGG